MNKEFYRRFYNIPSKVPDKNIEKFVEIYNEINVLNENQQLTDDRLKELRQKLRELED